MISKLPLLILLISPLVSEAQEDNSEFLLENAKLCGDPFSDPLWIPVLDACTIECDQNTEYCVENEDLAQQCKPLPDECQKLWAQRKQALAGGSAHFAAAGVRSANLEDNQDPEQEEVDKVIEKSVAKRVKFPDSRKKDEGTVVSGGVVKARSSDSTRHRVKRV